MISVLALPESRDAGPHGPGSLKRSLLGMPPVVRVRALRGTPYDGCADVLSAAQVSDT
jgi:hypothetical protein